MMPRQRIDAPKSPDFRKLNVDALFNLEHSRASVRLLQRMAGLPKLMDIYAKAEARRTEQSSGCIFQSVLDVVGVHWEMLAADRERIPVAGRVIVVANHPFGMLEGVVLGALLRQIRPDVRILANALLGRFPQIAEHLILVDPFGGGESRRYNRYGLRASLTWLEKGGMLVVFPAGEVSSFNLQRQSVADPVWSESVARLATLSGAPVLPLFIDGRNGAGFQLAGLVHPQLRTALLGREFLNKAGSVVRLRVGNIVAAKKMAEFHDDKERIEFLRRKTYVLASRGEACGSARRLLVPIQENLKLGRGDRAPVVGPTDPLLIESEIASLDERAILVRQGEFVVYLAETSRIPRVVRELGRLREITFRQAGEGTGKAIDLDEFDSYYLHLFVWNQKDKDIAGAYRLGQTDRILRHFGLKGLYTRKLFAYRREFLERISPALELGRSFVVHKYQRVYAPLLLLWKGISAFVCQNPHYRILFGPVSISNAYHPSSRQLMVSFLREYCRAADLAKLVRARSPFRTRPLQGWSAGEERTTWDVEELSAFIADIETDKKGLPILLKQYLKLGGKLLSFNVDRKFSQALDGLIVVDLLDSDPALLERYMGKTGFESFLRYHSRQAAEAR